MKIIDLNEDNIREYTSEIGEDVAENISREYYRGVVVVSEDGEEMAAGIIWQYKNLKGLKKENLRDNMSDLELVLTMLSEATTTEISKQRKPTTFSENMEIAKSGGEAAGEARKAVESRTGQPVITAQNAAQLNAIVTNVVEGIAESAESDAKEDA